MQPRAEDETARLILEGNEPVREEWLFRGFSDQKIENIFHRLLFVGTKQDDESYRAKFEQLLRQKGDRPKLREAVKRVFHEGQREDTYMRVFLRRFAWQPAFLDYLFRCLALKRQDMVVKELARFNDGAFSEELYNIYVRLQKDDAPPTTYERAMLGYLSLPQGKGIKRMIARSAHFSFISTATVEENLSAIMNREVARVPGDAEEAAAEATGMDAGTVMAADAATDEAARADDVLADDDKHSPPPRVSIKPHPASAGEASPSLPGKVWGFMKSLLAQPELDADDSGVSGSKPEAGAGRGGEDMGGGEVAGRVTEAEVQPVRGETHATVPNVIPESSETPSANGAMHESSPSKES